MPKRNGWLSRGIFVTVFSAASLLAPLFIIAPIYAEEAIVTSQITPEQLAAPAPISPVNNAVVKGDSITQSWSAPEGAVSYVYESYHDEALKQTRWRETFKTTSKTATNVAETTYWWRVRAVDAKGQKSAWSEPYKITVDNTAPVVRIDELQAGQGQLSVRGTATDANGIKAGQVRIVLLNTTDEACGTDELQSYTVQVADGQWQFAIEQTGLPAGMYCLQAVASDTAGNEARSLMVRFEIPPPPNDDNDEEEPEVPTEPTPPQNQPEIEPLQPVEATPVAAPTVNNQNNTSQSQQIASSSSPSVISNGTEITPDFNGDEDGIGLAESREVLGAQTENAGVAWYWWVLAGILAVALVTWFGRRLWRASADQSLH